MIKKSDFDQFRLRSSKVENNALQLRWKRGEKHRLGIIVPKSCVGKAHQRNKIKRVIREYFRLHREKFPRGDLLVIAKSPSESLKPVDLRSLLLELLVQSRSKENLK